MGLLVFHDLHVTAATHALGNCVLLFLCLRLLVDFGTVVLLVSLVSAVACLCASCCLHTAKYITYIFGKLPMDL